MSYKYSELDNRNLRWFPSDDTRATLLTIHVDSGKIRGLQNLRIDFSYPITAIAGRNGSGKTTIIELAACAYHNTGKGFKLSGRKYPYYTFSDFFFQTSTEGSLSGIKIRYQFIHNKWRSPKNPAGRIGPGWQERIKRHGGRWNDYDGRIKRTVVYLGIDRTVPHSEKSVAKSYRKLFEPMVERGWELEVKDVVGRIMGKDYSTFTYMEHSIYRIPIVSNSNFTYSGFNMGAGEGSIFELFSIIRECPDGTLIVIDEIELGLHEDAQTRLINELKIICERRKFQIICTTHSPRILESLPPEGRIYLEPIGEQTNVIKGISPEYATGKLSGRKYSELGVFVEDETAKLIVENCLTAEMRSRIDIIPIGSAIGVMRQLAARYKENEQSKICVLLDGDKRVTHNDQVRAFINATEKPQSEILTGWVENRTNYLPGTEWPELWVIRQRNEEIYKKLAVEFGLEFERLIEILESAERAGKHNEFHEVARIINFNQIVVSCSLIKAALETNPEEPKIIFKWINSFLN